MLSPEFYAFKRVQAAMNRPYLVASWLIVAGCGIFAAYLASQELTWPALAALGMAVYFLFGALTLPSTGPVYAASRVNARKAAMLLVQDELIRNPMLDLEHMRRFADNERKVRSTAAIIYDVLTVMIDWSVRP